MFEVKQLHIIYSNGLIEWLNNIKETEVRKELSDWTPSLNGVP